MLTDTIIRGTVSAFALATGNQLRVLIIDPTFSTKITPHTAIAGSQASAQLTMLRMRRIAFVSETVILPTNLAREDFTVTTRLGAKIALHHFTRTTG